MADPTNFAEMNSFPAVWQALGRLYDSTVETRGAAEELRASIADLHVSTSELRDAANLLLNAVERHQTVIEAHERRLDRTEITVEAILEDLRRHREGRSPQ